jgi:hypothetical protein
VWAAVPTIHVEQDDFKVESGHMFCATRKACSESGLLESRTHANELAALCRAGKGAKQAGTMTQNWKLNCFGRKMLVHNLDFSSCCATNFMTLGKLLMTLESQFPPL